MISFLIGVAAIVSAIGSIGSVAQAQSIQVPADIRSAGVLQVGTWAQYPPYSFMEGSEIRGIEIDIAKAIAMKFGVQAKFQNVSANSLIPGLASKRFDVVMTGLFDTPARQQVVDFVDYEQTSIALVVSKAQAGIITSMEAACGHSASVVQSSTSQSDLQKFSAKCVSKGKPPIRITVFQDEAASLLAVESGRAEFRAYDLPVALYQTRVKPSIGVVIDTHEKPSPQGAAIAKTNTQLRDALLAAVQQLYKEGEMAKIFEKWQQPEMILEPGINLATK